MVKLIEGEIEDHIPALLGHVHPKKKREIGEHSFMFDMSNDLLRTFKTAESFMAAILIPQDYMYNYRSRPDEKWIAEEPCNACLLTKVIHDREMLCAILNITHLWSWLNPYCIASDGDSRPSPMFAFLEECLFLLNHAITGEVQEKLQRRIYAIADEFKVLVERAEADGVERQVIRFAAEAEVQKEILRRDAIEAQQVKEGMAVESKAVISGLVDGPSMPQDLCEYAAAPVGTLTTIPIYKKAPHASSIYSHRPSFPPPPARNPQRLLPDLTNCTPESFVLSSAPQRRRPLTCSTRSTYPWRLLRESQQITEYQPDSPYDIDEFIDSYTDSKHRPTTSFYVPALNIINGYIVNPSLRLSSSKPTMQLDSLRRQLWTLSMLEDVPPPLDMGHSKPKLTPLWATGIVEPSVYELE